MGDLDHMKENNTRKWDLPKFINISYESGKEQLKDIQRLIMENLVPYKYPREIEFVKGLPKMQSCKIKR